MTLGKILVLIVFLLILASLGSAMFFLIRDKGSTNRTARSLTLRIGLSVGLFVLLFVMYAAGVIEPHGVRQ